MICWRHYWLFAAKFHRLFNRDIYRSYQQIEENMQFVKGRILFTQTIRENKYRKYLHYRI